MNREIIRGGPSIPELADRLRRMADFLEGTQDLVIHRVSTKIDYPEPEYAFRSFYPERIRNRRSEGPFDGEFSFRLQAWYSPMEITALAEVFHGETKEDKRKKGT